MAILSESKREFLTRKGGGPRNPSFEEMNEENTRISSNGGHSYSIQTHSWLLFVSGRFSTPECVLILITETNWFRRTRIVEDWRRLHSGSQSSDSVPLFGNEGSSSSSVRWAKWWWRDRRESQHHILSAPITGEENIFPDFCQVFAGDSPGWNLMPGLIFRFLLIEETDEKTNRKSLTGRRRLNRTAETTKKYASMISSEKRQSQIVRPQKE